MQMSPSNKVRVTRFGLISVLFLRARAFVDDTRVGVSQALEGAPHLPNCYKYSICERLSRDTRTKPSAFGLMDSVKPSAVERRTASAPRRSNTSAETACAG